MPAVQALNGHIALPPICSALTITSSLVPQSFFQIDAAAEAAAVVFQVPKAGNIDAIGFLITTVNTSGDVEARLETMAALSTSPSGNLVSAGANGAATVSAPGWHVIELDTPAAVTRGTVLAMMIVGDATNVPDIVVAKSSNNDLVQSYHPSGRRKTTSWLTPQSSRPIMAARYDDGTWGFLSGDAYAFASASVITVESDTTPDEIGLKFQLPFPVRAAGLWITWDTPGDLTTPVPFKLYDSINNEIAGTSVIETNVIDLGATHTTIEVLFANPVALSGNVPYRLTWKPATTFGAGKILKITFDDAAVMAGTQVMGSTVAFTSRTDSGAWTDDDTSLVLMGLLVDGFGEGASLVESVIQDIVQ